MAMPEAAVSLGSVWMLGVALGLTACTVTCLPFMGSWALGRQAGMRWVLRDTAAFLLGRLVAYAGLGALAGGLGAWLVLQLAGGIGNAIIGTASLCAAGGLLWPPGKSTHASCRPFSKWSSGSPFFIGVSLTMIPCAPLTTLLATCAAGNSALAGAQYGAAFGAGTLLTPMLVLIPACGRFGLILRAQHQWLAPWIRGLAALVLAMLGINRLALLDTVMTFLISALLALIVLWAHVRIRRTARSEKIIPLQIIH